MSIHNQRKKAVNWSRLDNVAKIFPPTSHGSDTGVFRLSCELTEPVDTALLQSALDDTLKRYPHLLMVMRRGVFWYYLEQTDLHPVVEEENLPPCAPLYEGSKSLLFRVCYWRQKISLEVYHVLADGSGAIEFFQALITAYLSLLHPEICAEPLPQASIFERKTDSFQKYYRPNISEKASKRPPRAYRLRGTKRPDKGLTIIEGVASVKQVLAAAHRYHTTLTGYLTALFFIAVHEEMYVRDERHPVVLTIPVDLRGYFPSNTTRNFFGTIRVGYDFSKRSGELSDVIEQVVSGFKAELTPDSLGARMNRMIALERNPLLRPIPLVLKNPILRFSGDVSERGETAVISNIGKFHLPPSLAPYAKGFGVFMSTHATQLCTCSFGDELHFGFTSAFETPELQRRFFALLVNEGIEIEVRSNEYQKEVQSVCSDAPTAE